MADSECPLLETGEGSALPTNSRPQHRFIWSCLCSMTAVVLLTMSARHGPPLPAVSDVGLLLPSTEKVRVELYGMAGCPFTRRFIEGPLTETLAAVPDLVEFQLFPFGNCYYETAECGGTAENYTYASYFQGYSQTVRQCWDDHCGAAANVPSPDCFSGQLLCQHGAVDGMVTTAWACAKSMTHDAASSYMPFVLCTAQRFLSITSGTSFRDVLHACSPEAHTVRDEIVQCASGKHGRDLLNKQARLTISHPAVPQVLIDGTPLDDTGCVACGDGIMQKVCEAAWYKHGLEPPPCKGIFGLSKA